MSQKLCFIWWHTYVKWWYLQQFFFSFFQNSDFLGFSKFISKCQKEILRCAPPSSHVCDFFSYFYLCSLSCSVLLFLSLPFIFLYFFPFFFFLTLLFFSFLVLFLFWSFSDFCFSLCFFISLVSLFLFSFFLLSVFNFLFFSDCPSILCLLLWISEWRGRICSRRQD